MWLGGVNSGSFINVVSHSTLYLTWKKQTLAEFLSHIKEECPQVHEMLIEIFLFSFWPHHMLCGILDPGWNLGPLHWEHGVLTTGSQGSP